MRCASRASVGRRTLAIDLDGTLTDNFAGIAGCIRHALASLQIAEPGDDALRACVGPPMRESLRTLLGSADPTLVETALAHYRNRYATLGWRENVAYPGIGGLLNSLADNGERLYLCTTKPQQFAEMIVAHFGFVDHFIGIYGTTYDGALDDKATLFSHMLTQEALEPARCVMIGDRQHDVRAARNNGARSIGVLWGYGSRAELDDAGAGAIVATPEELAIVLDRDAWR